MKFAEGEQAGQTKVWENPRLTDCLPEAERPSDYTLGRSHLLARLTQGERIWR